MKTLLLLLLTTSPCLAQLTPDHKSIHQIESERHRYDSSGQPTILRSTPARVGSALSKRVFGYYPYWSGANDHLGYDFGALTTIGYFSMEADTTGSYASLHAWKTTPLIGYAHARGVKVVLVVTGFGYNQNDAILSDPVKRERLIATIVDAVKSAGGDGVNIDFESVRSSQRGNLVQFMRDLASAMRSAIPGAEVSMATPAVDWSNAFDLGALSGICDYLILMGYDYYWSGSGTAGPVAPLGGESYNVTRSVTTYLSAGVEPEKLLLGVPWYGLDWPVADTSRKAKASGTGKAVVYRNAEPAAEAAGKIFDAPTASAWYRYSIDTIMHQVWFDDSMSLALKYDLVRSRGLGGIGIWALGYEGGRGEIWRGIEQAFALPGDVAEDRNHEKLDMKIYPNPSGSFAAVQVLLRTPGQITLSLFDALGRRVYESGAQYLRAGENTIGLHLIDLPPGIYTCSVQSRSMHRTGRLAVIR
jgi:spore germination protein YaaH